MAIYEGFANPIEDHASEGASNEWEEPWEGHSGKAVESFITKKLKDSEDKRLVDMQYANNELTLIFKDNTSIKRTVAPIEPSYIYGLKLYGLKVNDKLMSPDNSNLLKFQYKEGTTVKVGVIFYAVMQTLDTQNQLGTYYVDFNYNYETVSKRVSPIDYKQIKFSDMIGDQPLIGSDIVGLLDENGEVISNQEKIDSMLSWVDITNLFMTSATGNLVATFATNDSVITDQIASEITVQKIDLKYTEQSYITKLNSIAFTLEGADYESNYHIEGWNMTTKSDNDAMNVITSSGVLSVENLTPGLNQFVLRAADKNGTITSDFITVDIIYTPDDYIPSGAIVAINKVNNIIPNNGVATLYDLTVWSPNKASCELTTYLESVMPFGPSDFTNIVKLENIDKSTYGNDKDFYTTNYKKYIEVESDGNTPQYLGVKINDKMYQFMVAEDQGDSTYLPVKLGFKSMVIEQINQNLRYVRSGVSDRFNFDQSTGQNNGLFVTAAYANASKPQTIADNIEISDGWKENDGRVVFSVSAQEKPILKQPLNLELGDSFTVEIGVKTHNVSNEDAPILTIGNWQLRSNMFCWNTDDSTLFKARNAQFDNDDEIHIVVTGELAHSMTPGEPYYPNYLGEYQDYFNDHVNEITYPLIRIYINGVIDREVILDVEDYNKAKNSALVINPSGCDADFYLFRVYQGRALSFDEVLQNYIAFVKTKEEKVKIYNNNDIMDNGKISFRKCFGKYNTIVYVLPEGCRIPTRGWGGADDKTTNKKAMSKYPVTVFVNYADPAINNKYGGKIINGQMTSQGSSAMRYLIWNVQTALQKFKDYRVDADGRYLNKKGEVVESKDDAKTYKRPSFFVSYGDGNYDAAKRKFNADCGTTLTNAYILPIADNQTYAGGQKVKKLVGKVNFASSMQSHKEGAIKLFNNAYNYTESGWDDWKKNRVPSGPMKACDENPFLYFYWESPKTCIKGGSTRTEDFGEDYSWKDYPDTDVAKTEIQDLFDHNNDVHFFGFQTWGSAKADNATYGYDEDNFPGYILMEGGENTDVAVNFRCPWHALQRYDENIQDVSGIKLAQVPTISKADSIERPWDNLFIKGESIYYHDRGAWDIDYGADDDGIAFANNDNVHASVKKFREFCDFVYKYDYSFATTNELTVKSTWDTTRKICVLRSGEVTGYLPQTQEQIEAGESPTPYTFSVQMGDLIRYEVYSGRWVPAGLYYDTVAKQWESLNVYTISGASQGTAIATVINRLKNKFKEGIGQYVDIEDIAFHQAIVRILSGTDNRAKNTYFQMIGPKVGEEVNEDSYKIRLMGDDLDTVLLTDNNGLQSKPYNLIENSYLCNYENNYKQTKFDEDYWGDSNNVFFYMFDQTYEQNINKHLGRIITFAFKTDGTVTNPKNFFNEVFFGVQKYFPQRAYNHTSKIYYETGEFVRRTHAMGGGDAQQDLYTNNNINPIEQAHGSGLSGELAFMKKRLAFLGSSVLNANTLGSTIVTGSSAGSGSALNIQATITAYQDYYPAMNWNGLPQRMNQINTSDYDLIKYMAETGNPVTLTYNSNGDPSINQGLYGANYYKTIDIVGLRSSTFEGTFEHVTDFTIDNNKVSEVCGSDYPKLKLSTFAPKMPVVKNLTLLDIELPALKLESMLKLETLNLSGSSTTSVTFPQSGHLKQVTLPETVTSFVIYNNPGLESVVFEGTNNIKDIIIDGKHCGKFNIAELCENISSNVLNSVEFYGVDINITEQALENLMAAPKCSMKEKCKFTIVDTEGNLVSIKFATYKMLVDKFGNIRNENNDVQVIFKDTDVTTFQLPASIALYGNTKVATVSPIIEGTDIQIVERNGVSCLNITYTISGASGLATIDNNTGVITATGKESDTTNAKVSAKFVKASTGQTVTADNDCQLIFKWVAPKIGDFVYSNGAYSTIPLSGSTLVGMVYAVAPNEGTTEAGTIYVIGSEYVSVKSLDSTYDSFYAGMTGEEGGLRNDAISATAYFANKFAEKILGTDIATEYKIGAVEVASQKAAINNIVKTSRALVMNANSFTGKEDTAKYIELVNTIGLPALHDKLSQSFKNCIQYEGRNLAKITNSVNLANLITALNVNYNWTTIDNYSQYQDYVPTDLASAFIFPYFYAMHLYQPEADDLCDDLKAGNWYAPSLDQLTRIVYYRGLSANASFTDTFDVRKDIVSGTTEEAIFSQAALTSRLGGVAKLPGCWKELFGTGASGTGEGAALGESNSYNLTTTRTNVGNYTYQYSSVSTYNTANSWWEQSTIAKEDKWVAGSMPVYQKPSYEGYPSGHEYESYEGSYRSWSFYPEKHKGIPFTQLTYSKPQ